MRSTIFQAGGRKQVLGMVHLPPLPGTPFHKEGSFSQACATAVADARTLDEGGAQGCLVQTVDGAYSPHDECDYARLAAVAIIVSRVVAETRKDFLVGVQIMKNALEASIAVAKVAGAHFVRASAFVGSTASPFGLIQGDPYRVLAYRKAIGAERVGIVADIHTQHFRWAGEPAAVGEIAKLAARCGAVGVCLGDPDEVAAITLAEEVRVACPETAILLSGYTSAANSRRLLACADGAFVGTYLQPTGWGGPISRERLRAYLAAVNGPTA